MKHFVNIAGINIHITAPRQVKPSNKLKRFLIKGNSEQIPDMNLCIRYEEKILVPDNAISLDEHIKWANKDREEINIFLSDKKETLFCLKSNNVFDKAFILANVKERHMISQFEGTLGEILFRNCLLNHQGMVIHASAIAYEQKGILFSAPSGTGKTTQANLWKKYKGAKIINADRPAIRIVENEPYIYGTLWNGSSKECINTSVRLSMIVVIEQSPVNEIIRLTGKEAVSKVMPRCFLPYFTKAMMDLALENLENIIGMTPVYLLKCRPDKEAVELVSQCIM